MSKLLIRALSTGRTGTKFLAEAFRNQGYNSQHEELYAGEPHVALHAYANYLGDTWAANPDDYFAHKSGFAKVYLRSVNAEFEKMAGEQKRTGLRKLIDKDQVLRNDVLLDWNNGLVLFTPLIHREASEQGFDSKYLILYRNPLKTVHAIFKVEGSGNYAHRPSTFSQGADYLGAARVWARYYMLMLDMERELGPSNFAHMDLETFSSSAENRQRIANFLGLGWDEKKFERFQKAELDKPLRSEKTPSARNSDLYKDKEFSFSDDQLLEIVEIVRPALKRLELDESQIVRDYRNFHDQHKEKLGFA
jgi:hypothetical protein